MVRRSQNNNTHEEEKESSNMRHVKIIGLCLFAGVVVAAIGSASASAALPEIYQCGAAAKVAGKYTGHYVGKHCGESEKATKAEEEEGKTNKYEFEPFNVGSKTEKTGKEGKVTKFKAKGAKGIGANLEIAGVGGTYCTKTSAEGEFTGPKSAGKVVATFTGCELLHKKCQNAGAKAGEIKTFPLKAELGYINTAEHLVGAVFSAESGEYLAHFECGEEIELRVSGSVIGEVEMGAKSPYNKFSKEVTILFEQSAGHQECRGGKECVMLESVPGEHKLLTAAANYPMENFSSGFESGEEDTIASKGEELYLKA
jgi:hypothetical protein